MEFRVWAPASRSVDVVVVRPRRGGGASRCGGGGRLVPRRRAGDRRRGALQVPAGREGRLSRPRLALPAGRRARGVGGGGSLHLPRGRTTGGAACPRTTCHLRAARGDGDGGGDVRRADRAAGRDRRPGRDGGGADADRGVSRRAQLGIRRRLPVRAGVVVRRARTAFRRFVDAAHARGLAVILDVVYNHLGPEGNYLHAVTGGRYFTGPPLHAVGRRHRLRAPAGARVRHPERPALGARVPRGRPADGRHPRHPGRLAESTCCRRCRSACAPSLPAGPALRADRGGRAQRASGCCCRRRRGAGWTACGRTTCITSCGATRRATTRRTSATTRGPRTTSSARCGRGGSTRGRCRRTTARRAARRRTGCRRAAFVHCIQNHDQVGNRAFGDRLTETRAAPRLPRRERAAAAVAVHAAAVDGAGVGGHRRRSSTSRTTRRSWESW